MATTKSPYEIRLELLQMSKDHFDKIQEANNAIMNAIWAKSFESIPTSMNMETSKKMFEQFTQACKASQANYTFDDVIKKATEMYSFVNSK